MGGVVDAGIRPERYADDRREGLPCRGCRSCSEQSADAELAPDPLTDLCRDALEGDADRAASGVGADDRADLADDDVAVGQRAQRVDEGVDVVAVGVEHGEVIHAPAVGGDLLDEERQRLAPRPLLAVLLDDAVADLDDRLDRQRRGEQRLGVADAAALAQVVERVEGAEDARPGDEVAGELLDRVEAVAGRSAFGARQGDRAEPQRHRAGVDDPDVDALGGAGGELGALQCRREGARQGDGDDAGRPAVDEAPVRLLEAARRRRGRRRQLRRGGAAGPELVGAQLLAIDQLLVAEADAERHDLDPPALGELGGQVARAVGHHADRSSRIGHASPARPPVDLARRRRPRPRRATPHRARRPPRARRSSPAAGAGHDGSGRTTTTGAR